MQTVVVTGGAGFIGSHLCTRLLKDGYKVICIDNLLTGSENNIIPLKDNPNFSFINMDVIQGMPKDIEADFVFHLASPASPNHHSPISYHKLPMETMMVNTIGTLNALEFAHANNAKFLFSSTSEVYGDPLEHPQKEDYRGNVSTIGPRLVYDEAKRFGETLVAYFWREKGLDARIARIFNTYGPDMQRDDMRMILQFITQALSSQPITVFGDGKQTRSLCYISDTVDGLCKCMFLENTNKQVINIGSDQEHSVMEYAQLVKELIQSESKIELSESLPQDDPLQRQADITKAKKLLGWSPRVPLEDGLLKMIEYCKNL